jgi:hypothetical protein
VQAVVTTPLQAPPQAVPSDVQAARVPTGAPLTAVQVPSRPARPHASHWPLQLVLQQTPSVQKPLAHWLPSVQVAPLVTLGTQVPLEHQSPLTHWASLVQDGRQAVGPQAYGAQAWVWAAGQEPPVQAAAAVEVPVEGSQLASRHEVVG